MHWLLLFASSGYKFGEQVVVHKDAPAAENVPVGQREQYVLDDAVLDDAVLERLARSMHREQFMFMPRDGIFAETFVDLGSKPGPQVLCG